jgi:hypothetical protein
MDERITHIRECADFLSAPHGGDREAACLVKSVRFALELCVDILAGCGVTGARGYRDALDRLVECRVLDGRLAMRMAGVCDVAERLAGAWSTVTHDEFEWARWSASQTLNDFADVAERQLATHPTAHPPATP